VARIAGVDLPRDKRVEAALPYIYGIGLHTSQVLLQRTGINPDTRVRELTDDEVNRLREIVDSCGTQEEVAASPAIGAGS
jgi:small subunit ribosomal protein S13